ncbi:MAG: cyclic nucleotide-binding domain-containing protein [Alphaproteobacteria bacterium]|nr:cyclic nucleotide-binding domain-containing protein [Alphaproteobacteria bacterium]
MALGPFDFSFFERYNIPLKRFAAGDVIFSQNDPGDLMFVVLEGKVDITVGDKVVETVGLHGIFGEMALIDRAPRSATVKASSATELAVIDENSFIELVRKSPVFSLYVMRQMASRLRHMNEAV